jgi:hypothetical protein
MYLSSTILISLALLMTADWLRWRLVVGRELKRRNLVRVPGDRAARITPAKGFRVIKACNCKRDSKMFHVVILNRGWLRTRPSVEIDEA